MKKIGFDPTVLIPNAFVFLVVSFGIIARHEPPHSIRPNHNGQSEQGATPGTTRSRLWEDPLSVLRRGNTEPITAEAPAGELISRKYVEKTAGKVGKKLTDSPSELEQEAGEIVNAIAEAIPKAVPKAVPKAIVPLRAKALTPQEAADSKEAELLRAEGGEKAREVLLNAMKKSNGKIGDIVDQLRQVEAPEKPDETETEKSASQPVEGDSPGSGIPS